MAVLEALGLDKIEHSCDPGIRSGPLRGSLHANGKHLTKKWRRGCRGADLAAGVGAAGPVNADLLGEVQLLLQLLHNSHRAVLRLDHSQPAELHTVHTYTPVIQCCRNI